MSATITVTTRLAGLHHWPSAPEHRAYLRDLHRHLFVARATVTVRHDDRDVEYHDLGDELDLALRGAARGLRAGSHDTSLHDFGAQSCEALARHCCAVLAERFALVSVSVSEDDEFTATVTPERDHLLGAATYDPHEGPE